MLFLCFFIYSLVVTAFASIDYLADDDALGIFRKVWAWLVETSIRRTLVVPVMLVTAIVMPFIYTVWGTKAWVNWVMEPERQAQHREYEKRYGPEADHE